MTHKLTPGSTIGILGGGQLGRMLALAAAQLGLQCHIFAPGSASPAFDVATYKTVADYADSDALKIFAQHVDVVTFEFENVPKSSLLKIAEYGKLTFPCVSALNIIQDRLLEKQYISGMGIPVAPFCNIETFEDLLQGVADIGVPAMLKTRRFGYDGKGQVKIDNQSTLAEAYGHTDQQPRILEAFVEYEKELSIIAVRGLDGSYKSYDTTENSHSQQILRQSHVPANISLNIKEQAIDITKKIAENMNYVGVIAVEFFYLGETAQQPLLVNEIAPRVHNSGHWTLDACLISQFENHIRAIAGWPLADTSRHSDAQMTNLIGEDVLDWTNIVEKENTKIHLYRKEKVKHGRKMGHVTQIFPKT